MKAKNLLDFLHPDELSAEALTNWLQSPVKAPCVHELFAFDAVERLPQEIRRLLALEGNYAHA